MTCQPAPRKNASTPPNDLAVTANGAVQTLQVAVDDEGQVVQVLVCSQLQCTTRFRFVHFAVAKERPHVLLGGVLKSCGCAG